jgi:DNA-binding response OmpR family regulator
MAMRGDSHLSLPQARHRVLVLHENQQFAEAIQAILHEDGRMEVLWVDNAYEAGRVTRVQVPELILLNAHLPDLRVFDVLNRVRGDRTLEGLRVLCLADLGESVARRLVRSGADEVLPATCEPTLVLAAVRRQLGLMPRRRGRSGTDATMN